LPKDGKFEINNRVLATDVLPSRISRLIHLDIGKVMDRNIPQGTIIKSEHAGSMICKYIINKYGREKSHE
jgi:hypothetical protein